MSRVWGENGRPVFAWAARTASKNSRGMAVLNFGQT